MVSQQSSNTSYYYCDAAPPPPLAHLRPCAEGLLGSGLVGGLALPGCECGGLECATEGEGQLPGAVEGHLVDGVQVEGSFLLALASRQEADAWEEPGHA